MFNGSRTQKLAILLAIIFVASGIIAGILFVVQYGPSGFTTDRFTSGNTKGQTVIDEQKEEALQGLGNISIEADSENITLIPSDTDQIKAHYYGKYFTTTPGSKPELNLSRSGDSLKIQVGFKPGMMVLFFSSNLKLDVYIPRKYSADLKIETSSGNIKTDEMNLESFNCNTDSGTISGKMVNAKKASFETSSGKVSVNGAIDDFKFNSDSGDLESSVISKSANIETSAGNLKLSNAPGDVIANSDSGNISLTYNEYSNNIKAETSSGRVSIKLPSNAGFKLDYDTSSGRADCRFPVSLSGEKDDNNLKGTVGDGSGTIRVSTDSGDLIVSK